ncbi:unnamed protein product [Oppiella nova]|uniref:Uncharacterized protein n=1 Tax=Oppiella nova TaxID=334625 RepID=A0A7R9LCT7_9ACAR|nr:unnamed protein product [Oppiella nova]CAG2162130.1 unnamed protein product [Oppiella nova]
MARIDQQLIIPVINNEDNTIALINPSKSIDIRMKLRQVDANGVASDVQFAYSLDDEDNVFTALFDDNDIDFEIQFDNRTTDKRRMAFTMTYGKDYKFIAYKGLSKLRALGDSGHHLRFLSPNKSMANDFTHNKEPGLLWSDNVEEIVSYVLLISVVIISQLLAFTIKSRIEYVPYFPASKTSNEFSFKRKRTGSSGSYTHNMNGNNSDLMRNGFK